MSLTQKFLKMFEELDDYKRRRSLLSRSHKHIIKNSKSLDAIKDSFSPPGARKKSMIREALDKWYAMNETSMNRFSDSLARVAAVKSQHYPTNIAWAQAGLTNKLSNHPKELSFRDYSKANPIAAQGKRQILQDFLLQRRKEKHKILKDRSLASSGDAYKKHLKTAHKHLNGDRTAILFNRAGSGNSREETHRTVNNSRQYWKYRKEVGADNFGTPEMTSIVSKIS